MRLFRHDRRRRSGVLIGAIVYLVFLVTVPFEHDDFVSHLKRPTHCAACMSSPVGSSPCTPIAAEEWTLTDAGRAWTVQLIAASVLLPVRSTGRSPPAA
jgi:hypothetical protein